MLRFGADCHGVVGLSLANLGLFLASGLLLAFIVGGVYGGFWERSAELRTTASSLNTCVETLSAAYDETKSTIEIPRVPTLTLVSCSSQFLHLTTTASFGAFVSVTDQWRISVWPRPNGSWQSGGDLHKWLNMTFGHDGSVQDPVTSSVLENLTKDQQDCAKTLALEPFVFDAARPLIVEKVFVYADNGERGAFMVLYQTDSEIVPDRERV
jgi:hypothetical protein